MEDNFRDLDSYYDPIIVNEKGKACIMEKDNNLFYYDIDKKEGPHRILENYDILKSKSINGDLVSVLYSEESKNYFALYDKNKLLFRRKLDIANNAYNCFISCNDQKKILYVERFGANQVIYIIDENNLTDVSFEFSIKYHYPYIFYDYEKNEVWIQSIEVPNEIRRYIFVNTITAFDHTDTVFYKENYQNKQKYKLGMILTYENHHKIAELDFSQENAMVTRIQKPIKFTELPQANILSFFQIEGKNDKNKIEPCIVFHYLTQMKFYYIKTGKIKKHEDRRLNKRNIIQFNDRIFFWDDKGRTIERLETPIAKDEKQFFYKAYDAKNVIKMCKKTDYLPHKQCILICDEDKYVKIMSYDEVNKKFKVEKEFYVDQYFAQSDDLNNLETLCYTNKMLYSNNQSFMLSERGVDKNEDVTQMQEPKQFMYGTPNFPLVTHEHVIRLVQPNDYGYGQKGPFELYLSPPLNSYKIMNSARDIYNEHVEYFLHSDTSKIVRIKTPSYNQVSVEMTRLNGLK